MARPARLLAALGPDAAGPADADLLARFARHRDAGAFELLVYRHAPLVLRACRSVLRDRHAAEDAAQAVFLALARQAHAVRGATLAGWLFRVARRIAARAARRQPPRAADVALDALPAPTTAPGPDPADVRLLHDELARLPAVYRDPLLLMYFEGVTRDEAARRLGWPAGTVAGRVARAKQRLAVRLARRGVTLGALVATAEASPPGFAGATAAAAVEYVAGGAAGVQTVAAGLAGQELRRTAMGKVVKMAGVVLVCGVVALGLGASTGGDPPAAPPTAAPKAQPPTPANPAPPKAVFGKGFVVVPVTTDLQRTLLAGRPVPELSAFVAVDGEGLFPDDKSLALDALDINGLRSALLRLRPVPPQEVYFRTYFDDPKVPWPPEAGRVLVEHALESAGRRAGFKHATAVCYPAQREWRGFVAPLREDAGAADPEPGVGDEKARAYRVRTPLSRVLTGGTAGVLDVWVPVDTRNGGVAVPDGVADSARRALRELRLPRTSRVSVLFHHPVVWEDEGVGRRLHQLAVDWAAAEGLVGVLGG